MGSLRTPIGPLPSSIYWRRRVVLLLVLLLVGVLVLWALRGGGAGSAGSSQDDGAGGGPAPSITPGATDTESHIDERPGTGDDDDEDDDDPDGAGDEDAEGGGPAGDADGDGGAEDGEGDGDGDADGGAGGADGGDGPAEAGSGVPDCTPGEQLTVALRSEENGYSPDEDPTLRLALTNASGSACAADVGHGALTLLLSSGDEEVWSSEHCPSGPAERRLEVPAESTVAHTIEWDRRYSDREQCDGPTPPSAPKGTYLAEATLSGFPVAQTTFRLDED